MVWWTDRVRMLGLTILTACAAAAPAEEDVDTDPRDTAPAVMDACTPLTWSTAGAPLVLTWCTPCHTSTLPAAQRAGAPVGVDFDDADDVLAQAARVLARATGPGPTMPPSGGPSEAARVRLADWIACEQR